MDLELGYRFTAGLELGYRFTESRVHDELRARLQVHRVTGSKWA